MCFRRDVEDDYLEDPVRIIPYRRRQASVTVLPPLSLPEGLVHHDLVQTSNYIPERRMLEYEELSRQGQLEYLRQLEIARLQALAFEENTAELLAQEDAFRQEISILRALALDAERAQLQGIADEILLRETFTPPLLAYRQSGRLQLLQHPPSNITRHQTLVPPSFINAPIHTINGSIMPSVVFQQNAPQQQLTLAPVRRRGRSPSQGKHTNVFIDAHSSGSRDQINFNNSFNTSSPRVANNPYSVNLPISHQHQQVRPTSPLPITDLNQTRTKNVTNNYYYIQGPTSDTHFHLQPMVQSPPAPNPSAHPQMPQPAPVTLSSRSPVIRRLPTTSPDQLDLLPLSRRRSMSPNRPSQVQHPIPMHPSNTPLLAPRPSVPSRSHVTSTGLLPPTSTQHRQSERSRSAVHIGPITSRSALPFQPIRSRSSSRSTRSRSPLTHPPTRLGSPQSTQIASLAVQRNSVLRSPVRSYSPRSTHPTANPPAAQQLQSPAAHWQDHPSISTGSLRRPHGATPQSQGLPKEPTILSRNAPNMRSLRNSPHHPFV